MVSRGALFRNKNGPSGSSGGRVNLVGFRAGKMIRKDKMVYPDARKGYLSVYQSEDSLIHLCWKDRTSGMIEEDLIIFPDDCEFVRVPQCTTGRVYVLKFRASTRRMFFWMQEPETDKDDEWCSQINDILNNPPALASSHGSDGGIQTLLNGLSQQQLMQLYGMTGGRSGASLLGTLRQRNSSSQNASAHSGSGRTLSVNSSESPRTPRPPTRTDSKSNTSESRTLIQLSDLQNYLSTLTIPETTSETTTVQKVDLAGTLNADALLPIIRDDKKVAALQPHLPPSGAEPSVPREHLRETLASQQFRQAVSMFSSALQSGQLGPIVAQFGVNPEAITAAENGDLEEFVKALEAGKSSEIKPDATKKPPPK